MAFKIRNNYSSSRRPKPAARHAFSLIEVMIAIVLLGFGLVMVATMYPIAWNRAREMTEQSMTGSIADSAEQLLRSVLHVDGLNRVPPRPVFASSFAGDMVLFENTLTGSLDVLYYGDTRVHALNMENMAIRGPLGRRFYPYRGDPNVQQDAIPYLQEQLQPIAGVIGDDYGQLNALYLTGFGRAQIRFEDRLFPPLPPRGGVDANGVFVTGTAEDRWEEALDTRRFAYAVFHRQRGFAQTYNPMQSVQRMVGPDAPNPPAPIGPMQLQQALDDRYRDRSFDFYIVSLRRGQASYRFMQQNPDPRFTPDPLQRDMPVNVRGLDQDHDVVLPAPWRVQIFVPNGKPDIPYELRPGTGSSLPVATEGAPSIVHVNNPAFPTSSTFVLDMFQPGTWFIDEWNGQTYQVAERRIDLSGGNETAILTLDREMTVPDLDDLCIPGSCVDGNLDIQEQLRSVWVFPPPIETRDGSGNPIFEGESPVIGVEVRTLSYSPRP